MLIALMIMYKYEVYFRQVFSFKAGKSLSKDNPADWLVMLFLLLAVEILKCWEEQVEKQIKRIGVALARQAGQREVEKTATWSIELIVSFHD